MKIVRDTREKNGWEFPEYEITDSALKVGDYAFDDALDLFVIERKSCIAELAGNIFEDRFEREFQNMQHIKYKFMLFEFSMYDLLYYPQTANLPKRVKEKIKIDGKFILRKILEYQIKYNLFILFCDNRDNAQKVAISIFKRMENERKKT